MNNYLLRSTKGEKDMLENIPCLSEIDVNTQDKIWCFASLEHSLNPFGKIPIKNQVQTVNKKNGKVFIYQHRKYCHGFFVSLNCSEEFYNRNKNDLEKYIISEERQKEMNINQDNIPSWF